MEAAKKQSQMFILNGIKGTWKYCIVKFLTSRTSRLKRMFDPTSKLLLYA